MPHQVWQYEMSRYLLEMVEGIKQKVAGGDAPQLAVSHGDTPQFAAAPFAKCSVTVFLNMCQNEFELSPFTAHMDVRTKQTKSVSICVSKLALVDLSDLLYLQLPLRHAQLLEAVKETRRTRKNNCHTESELIASAKGVLHKYTSCRDIVCANARFLGLATCRAEADVDTRLGRMVDDLVETLKAKGKERLLHRCHPNQLATLAVYFHLFVDKRHDQTSQWHQGSGTNVHQGSGTKRAPELRRQILTRSRPQAAMSTKARAPMSTRARAPGGHLGYGRKS